MRLLSVVFVMLLAAILSRREDHATAGEKKEPAKSEAYLLVVPPAGGKEVKLADWRFSLGTRRLTWLSDAPANPKSKTPTGPEYLEFRQDNSTTYKDGILTLIPLTAIRQMEYDREKKSVKVDVVNASGKDETLTGTTKFTGINKLTIAGDAILQGLGSATVKFSGGSPDGVQRIRFPTPKAVEAVKGSEAVIIATDKEKTKHKAHGLQPLYLVDGAYRIVPHLMFKKTVKIDMDKIAKLRFIPAAEKKQVSTEFEVTLRDGEKHTLTLLTKIELEKKKSMTLVGLVGRVPVGYELFPPHTIQELRLVGDGDQKKK